jgi:hypothetical protein
MPPPFESLLARPLLSQALAGALGREPLLPPAPREVPQEIEQLLARPPRQRKKLWEFNTHLHCSIIGTCLSTGELRQVLAKIGRKEALNATEHDVHASAVMLAGKHRDGAKLLPFHLRPGVGGGYRRGWPPTRCDSMCTSAKISRTIASLVAGCVSAAQ